MYFLRDVNDINELITIVNVIYATELTFHVVLIECDIGTLICCRISLNYLKDGNYWKYGII